MPPDYIIFACFCLVLYFYINQSIQFRSTASAIQSVFSGDCRMTCRQSQVSGFSGISGLQTPGTSQPQGSSQGCVCETCPCALIENFLSDLERAEPNPEPNQTEVTETCICEAWYCALIQSYLGTCSLPARTYTLLTGFISQAYVNFLQSLQDAQEFVHNARQCRASCRKAELSSSSPFESNDDFSFAPEKKSSPQKLDKNTAGLPAIRENASKTSLAVKKTSTIFKDIFKKKKATVKETKDTDSESASDTEGTPTVSPVTGTSNTSCPKCIEEGKTCLRECPKTKKP